jgi:protein-L-isoaspartate O-methyltransferase
MERFLKSLLPVPEDVWDPYDQSSFLMLEAMERLKPIFLDAEVLDTGTGSGNLGLAALLRLGADHLVATDINSASIRFVKQQMTQRGLAERMEVLRGDLLEPIQGRTFDVALFNAPDAATVQAYAMSVGTILKPKGIALLMWHRGFEQTLWALVHGARLHIEPILENPFGYRVYAIARDPKRLRFIRDLIARPKAVGMAQTRAGLEEPREGLDPIGKEAQKAYLRRRAKQKERAWQRGYERQMRRIEEQTRALVHTSPKPTFSSTKLPPSSTRSSPLFPIGLDPSRWLEGVTTMQWELKHRGIAQVTLTGGKAVLFQRDEFVRGGRHLLLDFFLRPSNGAHLHVGRMDLFLDSGNRMNIAQGVGPRRAAFSKDAASYLTREGIALRGDLSRFERSRFKHPRVSF